MNILVPCGNAHQRVISAKRGFKSQGDGMIHPMDPRQLLSQPLPSLANGLVHRAAVVPEMEAMHELGNMDFQSPRALGHSHCWVSYMPTAETNTGSVIGHHSPGGRRTA